MGIAPTSSSHFLKARKTRCFIFNTTSLATKLPWGTSGSLFALLRGMNYCLFNGQCEGLIQHNSSILQSHLLTSDCYVCSILWLRSSPSAFLASPPHFNDLRRFRPSRTGIIPCLSFVSLQDWTRLNIFWLNIF